MIHILKFLIDEVFLLFESNMLRIEAKCGIVN